jgi:FtsH-binding integral membrane protein
MSKIYGLSTAALATLAVLVMGIAIIINEVVHPNDQPYITILIVAVTAVATWFGIKYKEKK